ncbi:hypothetical protein SAMN05661008_01581 [Alkalithermobacter thermoalcaliphilus JW-YL-7 = DSM 7308]|uniref:Lipoprotein n=1 Tax=Alkalithermobacter thermoalcaliphilus JW-YL-7 = DSM 7308 TaxID=1121328 RepID=A0A150FS81_CLOPD|nr:hypothetical protein JWYL7_1556 [[Clostridium] paradoxum JW-YL-7 = DSM 7308]SHL16426.1 hypothetical protein SAMN05661008_01581 [[Clostridium] paradoxum JW-YL-7 = DSM 7308]
MKFKFLALILIAFMFLTGCELEQEPKSISEENTNETVVEESKDDKINEYKEAIGIYFEEKDNKIHVNLLDTESDDNYFEFDSSLNQTIQDLKSHRLVVIGFDENSLVKDIKQIGNAQVEAIFNGMADNNFAEFNIKGYLNVFQISDELKEEFYSLEEGKKLLMTITNNDQEGANLIVTNIE